MSTTNAESGTNVYEIADGIFRISTPIPESVIGLPGGFTFNQFLVVDEEPLLFHTGPRRVFPLVRQAVAHVLGDVARLRWVSFSHVESDECGSLNEWLAAAPRAQPVVGRVAANVSVSDLADRPPRALADGEELALGAHRVAWLDAPHLPHNWECGYLIEKKTRTLLAGDLFTVFGSDRPPLTESEVLTPSEPWRTGEKGFAVTKDARAILEKLARTEPQTLALMHGSSFRGDGRGQLLALADALGV
jgi:flavorubredoxin